jgi:hypothetical protein
MADTRQSGGSTPASRASVGGRDPVPVAAVGGTCTGLLSIVELVGSCAEACFGSMRF